MNSFYDAEHFESDARITYTMHLLSQSALEVADHVRPPTYSALCTLLIQLGEGLDAYVAHFMALHARGSDTRMPVSPLLKDPWGPTLRHISWWAEPLDVFLGAINATWTGHGHPLGVGG